MKRKVLKLIVFFTVFFRFTIQRECRIALIEFKSQELINVYSEIDATLKP